MNIDKRVIDLLSETGSDLSKAHDFNFYLYFTSEEKALSAKKVIEKDGFEIEISAPGTNSDWLLLAYKTMIPAEVELTEIRHWFLSIAEELGGEYDGWEAAVIE